MSLPRRLKPASKLLGYARRYHTLLAMTVVMGLLSFAVTFIFPWLIGTAIDRIIAPPAGTAEHQRIHWLIILLIIGAVTAAVSSVAVYGRGHLSVKLGNRIITDLRQDLFDHLSRLSLQFYSRESTGSILSRLINDIQQASQIISGGGVLLALDLVQMLVGFILLMTVSWKIALACMAVLPLYALACRRFNPRVKQASDRVQSQISRISGTVQERLAGMALVKVSATEERESQRFKAENEEYYGRVVQQSSVSHLASAVSEILIHTSTLLLIGLGGYAAVYGQPHMTAGQVVKMLGWLGIMYGPVRHLAEINIVFQTSMASLDRVFQVLSITPKIVDRPRAHNQPPMRGEVIFDRVRFRYDDDSDESRVALADSGNVPAAGQSPRWIIEELCLTVPAGQRLALVGPSGSGKSTLVSLLPRLYDVSEGKILIDGVDIRDYKLKALRKSIAIVQQQSLVFSGTVRENLTYGCANVNEEQIIEAAKAANAHEFIRHLCDGYETKLGERGVTLSGGQLQRLSIARALLRNPRILILDEATSALDSESEALVQEALERVMDGRTCFIIAHRLSTIRNADRIVVLEAGHIAESGTHDELLRADGLYERLVRRQFAGTMSAPQELAKETMDRPIRSSNGQPHTPSLAAAAR